MVQLPTDLAEALTALGEDPGPAGHDPALFERVSRWRLACGDSVEAGRWHLWSLMPPEPEALRPALADLWRNAGDTTAAERSLAGRETWQTVALLLDQGRLDPARTLQEELLASQEPLQEALLMTLAEQWNKQERHRQALELLEPLERHHSTQGSPLAPPFLNLLAHTHRRAGQPLQALQRFQRSLVAQPRQPQVRLHLSQIALDELNRPDLAAQTVQQVLVDDPNHPWATALLRRALRAMGAWGSLLLLRRQDDPAARGWYPLPRGTQRRRRSWLQALEAAGAPTPASRVLRNPPRPVSPGLLPPDSRDWALWGILTVPASRSGVGRCERGRRTHPARAGSGCWAAPIPCSPGPTAWTGWRAPRWRCCSGPPGMDRCWRPWGPWCSAAPCSGQLPVRPARCPGNDSGSSG
ncbi:hypothetical protein EVJ50_09455 [Synechococcus sp. RSCCF101]|uniref:tetratricopeptide repeat protein n=1 Tax=Synechococcus sp. RSCCF101 TaxID=2511069 RepID=UPI0012476862|nr:hypothetical protein [Synechococcus sp. RSCCF101]QEY32407.1 hypothetical protein EVJ50_09455 [Synechococcus sp. RSCCF101]